jgi:four helix bundle protein
MANTIFAFRDLDAWQAGMDSVVTVYRVAARLPASELYVLSAQMRRAALSIPTNVAEGHCRRSPRAYINHLNIALGSQGELETEIEVADRLGFIDANGLAEMARLSGRLRPLLHSLRRAIAHRHGLDDTEWR